MDKFTFTAKSLEDTQKFAEKISKTVKAGDVICLYGQLGSGKTTFTKFLVQALGSDPDEVLSPTFVYWRIYKTKNLHINHFDFYRIEKDSEVDSIGFGDAMYEKNSITVVEWPEKVKKFLPVKRTNIYFEILGNESRLFKVSNHE